MLSSMSLELQTYHENMDAYIIIMHLKELFNVIRYTERYKASKKLFHCKMTEDSSVNTYMLRIIGYFKEIRPIGLYHRP